MFGFLDRQFTSSLLVTSTFIGISKWSTFSDFNSFCNSISLSIRLATATVTIPDIANRFAMALPIPAEAPVTKAIFPLNDGEIMLSGIEFCYSKGQDNVRRRKNYSPVLFDLKKF